MIKNLAFSMITFLCLLSPLIASDFKEALAKSDPKFEEARKLWLVRCSKCHNIRLPSDFDETRWDLLLFHMRVQAQLTEKERISILKFIQESKKGGGTP